MTTTAHETEIVVDPDVPLVRIIREFDAPPANVYRAHVEADLFARWTGPDGVTIRVDRWDPTTGGSYRYVIERDDADLGFYGSFHELRPSELIVQTFTFEGMADDVALEKIRFHDLGDGRTRLSSTSLVDDFASRDAFVASGMETGVVEGYRRLDSVVAAL